LWNFGDGTTATSQNVSHTYTANGNYTVSLKVTNSTGSFWTRTKTGYITIAAAPEVDFSAVPVSGYVPLTILFTDLSTLGGISTWYWDFGDGTTSTEQNPIHTYNISGGYTVSLTVSNFAGQDTKVKASYITVSYVNAAFSANTTTGTTSLDVQFTDESLGNPTSWSWDFGGGASSSTAQNPVVHFAVPGLYTVKLTASNSYGVDSITKYGYIKISDDGSATTMTIANVTDTWAYVPLNSSRDFTFSSNQAVALSYYQMNGGTVVNATNQSMAYTFTEPGYYVMEVWAENGNGQSNVIEFRTRVGRALASEHLTPLNDSAYYELENATLNMSTDSILTSLIQPFTASIGRSFYLVLFVLPFVFLWFQQGKLTIPTTLALITGCLFVHYVPDTFVTFIGLAIVMSFAANFYKISRGP
jgi:PKD repeat protein